MTRGILFVLLSSLYLQRLNESLAFGRYSIIFFFNAWETKNLKIKVISILASRVLSLALVAQN